MAINKKLLHFKTFANFNSQKLSANEANTSYTIGVGGVTYLGTPVVRYQSICWIRDTKQMWTHGTLYDCNGGDGASVYHLNESLSASGTLSQDAYDGVMNADIVTIAGSIADREDDGDGNVLLVVHSSSGNIAITITLQIASDKTYTYTSEFFVIPTKVSDLENDSVYITDFDVLSLLNLANNPVEVGGVRSDNQAITDALAANKTILVPYEISDVVSTKGYATLVGYAEDLLYFKVITDSYEIFVETQFDATSILGQEVTLREWADKQDSLISGTNIKTINGNSILGSGDIEVAPIETFEDRKYVNVVGITDDAFLYALPTSANGDEDDVIATRGTLKTINGQSLLGSGDITISGGGGSSAYSEVSHGTSDITFALTPNTFHIWDEVSSLTLTLGAETSGVANEYLFQFTSGSTATTLSLPDDIKWTGGDEPTIEANKIYQISILKGLGSVMEWENSNIGTFTINYGQSSMVDFNFDKGMTWQDFVGSEYNTDSAITINNSRVVYLNSFIINDVSPTDAIINKNIYSSVYWD